MESTSAVTDTSDQEPTPIAESASSLQAYEDVTEVAGEAFQQIVSVSRSQEQYERGLAAKEQRAMEEAFMDARTSQARTSERRKSLIAECARFKSAGMCGEILSKYSRHPKPCARPSVKCDPDGYCAYHRRRYGVNKGVQSAVVIKRALKARTLATIRARRAHRLQHLLPELEQASTPTKKSLLALPAESRFGRRKAKLLTGSPGHASLGSASPPAPSQALDKNDVDGDAIMEDCHASSMD